MNKLCLKVDVPITSFRNPRAREYWETFPVPPPSTVYGMLLSMVGEESLARHCGVKIAIAMLSKPNLSIVLRKMKRFKVANPSDKANSKPDFQELLTDVRFLVWIDAAGDRSDVNLPDRLMVALTNPSAIDRYGGLSLGESHNMVNAVSVVDDDDIPVSWLVQDDDGLLTLPYWADKSSMVATKWRRYSLLKHSSMTVPNAAWTDITS